MTKNKPRNLFVRRFATSKVSYVFCVGVEPNEWRLGVILPDEFRPVLALCVDVGTLRFDFTRIVRNK